MECKEFQVHVNLNAGGAAGSDCNCDFVSQTDTIGVSDAAKDLERTSLSELDGISAIVDSDMPEPRSFERGPSAPARLIIDGPLPRRHSITEETEKNSSNRTAWKASALMTQSMPNLNESRSLHNRGIGMMVLSSPSETGNRRVQERTQRSQELETLLEGL